MIQLIQTRVLLALFDVIHSHLQERQVLEFVLGELVHAPLAHDVLEVRAVHVLHEARGVRDALELHAVRGVLEFHDVRYAREVHVVRARVAHALPVLDIRASLLIRVVHAVRGPLVLDIHVFLVIHEARAVHDVRVVRAIHGTRVLRVRVALYIHEARAIRVVMTHSVMILCGLIL